MSIEADVRKELSEIRKELHMIKESMPDKGMFLTAEETKLLHESHENESKGKLISGEDLLKELSK